MNRPTRITCVALIFLLFLTLGLSSVVWAGPDSLSMNPHFFPLPCSGKPSNTPPQKWTRTMLRITTLSCKKKDGRRIRLAIHLKDPRGLPEHPDHFHLYVDGKMATMISMTGPEKTVTLPRLAAGRHRLWFIAADMMTHRIMTDSGMDQQMGGMNGSMNGMSSMSMGSDATTLSVIPPHSSALSVSIDVR